MVQGWRGRYTEHGGNTEKTYLASKQAGWGGCKGEAFGRTPEMWKLASALSDGDRETC